MAENVARDVQFRKLLIALPLLATLPYLPALINPPTILLALLSLTSLLSTAYLLHHQPPASSGIPFLDAWARPKTPHPTRAPSVDEDDDDDEETDVQYVPARRQRKRRSSFSFVERRSPLETYLPFLNLGLGLLLILMAWAVGRTRSEAVWPGMGFLPLVIYIIVLVSKMVMGSVDPDKELTALRYEYKGA